MLKVISYSRNLINRVPTVENDSKYVVLQEMKLHETFIHEGDFL